MTHIKKKFFFLSTNHINTNWITLKLRTLFFKRHCRASLVVQTVKNLPAMQETWVRSLGQEDPLEEGMATHSGILGWRIPWTEEPDGLQSTGS